MNPSDHSDSYFSRPTIKIATILEGDSTATIKGSPEVDNSFENSRDSQPDSTYKPDENCAILLESPFRNRENCDQVSSSQKKKFLSVENAAYEGAEAYLDSEGVFIVSPQALMLNQKMRPRIHLQKANSFKTVLDHDMKIKRFVSTQEASEPTGPTFLVRRASSNGRLFGMAPLTLNFNKENVQPADEATKEEGLAIDLEKITPTETI